MGRSEKSQGLAPPAIRKEQRAKLARHIVNKTIPAILVSNARARKGVESSELIIDPGPATGDVGGGNGNETKEDEVMYVKRKGQGRRKVKGGNVEDEHEKEKGKLKGRKKGGSIDEDLSSLSLQPSSAPERIETNVRIIRTDTLTAAHMLVFPSKYPSSNTTSISKSSGGTKKQNPCILNMASPLRPGGGVLTGATSQEEFLCARTTLLPSLQESFYRLPEIGGVFTRDVLVFYGPGSLDEATQEFGAGERYWVDVVSAGMLRFPDLEGEEGSLGLGKKDREMVERKMRAMLRIAKSKGARKVVLGAWGCGAYGNPVADVAKAWERVLAGDFGSTLRKGKRISSAGLEPWGFEDVLFAISHEKMAQEFAREYGNIEVEKGPGNTEVEQEEEEDEAAEELRNKIEEMEGQIGKVWNPELKERLGYILEGLKMQLMEREGGTGDDDDDDGEVGKVDTSVPHPYDNLDPVWSSDEESGGYHLSNQGHL